jgi:predicted transcriptional regulator
LTIGALRAYIYCNISRRRCVDVQFTDREADVMQVLWDRGPSLVAEVRAALRDELAYTTVLTILRTLEAKGHVGHAEEGRGHRYFARVKQTTAQTSALRHITAKLFKGSAELLLTRLVSDETLSPEAVARMRKLLDEHADDRPDGDDPEGGG